MRGNIWLIKGGIAVFILSIGCNSKKITSEKQAVVTYPSGEIEWIRSLKGNKKDGFEYHLTKKGDTIQKNYFEKDSLIFSLSYNLDRKKIEDKRKIFFEIQNKNPKINDTIVFEYYVKGPQLKSLLLTGTSMRIRPDTSNRFYRNIYYDYEKQINKLMFVPNEYGRYKIRFSCFDENLLKIVGYSETFLWIE